MASRFWVAMEPVWLDTPWTPGMASRSTDTATRTGEQLQDRLVSFAVEAWELCRALGGDSTMARTADQLVRAATSVAANYAEACAAESRRDFVHKMQICLKELRETGVWLEILRRVGAPAGIGELAGECDELTRIFVTSIRTARRAM